MENFRSDGYRPWLSRAIRVDDDNDWSVHTIDYTGFKKKLQFFSKRRQQLRALLAQSGDDSILATELDNVMGPPPQLPPGYAASEEKLLLPTPRAAGRTRSELIKILGGSSRALIEEPHQTNYVPFPDEEGGRVGGRGQADPALDTDVASPSSVGHIHASMVPMEIDTDDAAKEQNAKKSQPRFWGPARVKRRVVMRQVSNFERNDLTVFLANELDGVAMFYLSQWQALSQQLVDLQTAIAEKKRQQLGNVTSSLDDPQLKKLGHELLELEAFVVTNLLTVRQMLIRYDAFARAYEGTPMMGYYMKLMSEPKSQLFRAKDQDGNSLSRSLRKLMQHAELQALSETYVDLCSFTNNGDLVPPFQRQKQEFHKVLESSERAQAVASSGHAAPLQDTLLQNLRYYFLLGMMEDRLGFEPTYLTSRGTSLTKEMQILADWRNKSHHHYSQNVEDELRDHDDDYAETWSTMGYQKIFNLVMALVAAFLYCMNYYIVEPSSTMYVNVLGGQDALSGALIGMMPMASFLSAIAFSIWTNHSFRQPFLLSCILMLSGNLIYSFAYNYKSLTMAFVGRFMTGLGGPKCIIRRYMADTTSLSIRTSVNAFFGMVVAAGSAFGPGCAILLNQISFSIPLPGGGEIWLNGLTGPGFLMATLWAAFLVALVFQFQEPERTGLEEQRKLERLQTKEEEIIEPGFSHDPDTAPKDLSTSSNSVVSSQQYQRAASGDDDMGTIMSVATSACETETWMCSDEDRKPESMYDRSRRFFRLVTFPVRICLALLFSKVFVIETLVSSTSSLTKNRYQWQVLEVGSLGCANGLMVIPLSMLVGRLSMSHQDRFLLMWLLGIGLFGILIMIDPTDLINTDSNRYNDDSFFAVGPHRYILGYCLIYMSIQSLEGVIGSALSKLIPTALASGTLNSGLLATLVDTMGRTCGDLFISLCGFINLRQLINLLFIPGAIILTTCLLVVRRYYDLLAV